MDRSKLAERDDYIYQFGQAEFDSARFSLKISGQEINLERKPLELLHKFLCHPGDVLGKAELLDDIWEGRPTVENVLPNAVAKLRKALGPDHASAITTVPRIGYKFVSSVHRRELESQSYATDELSEGQAVVGREKFRLRHCLGHSFGNVVWLAQNENGEARVFKFSLDTTAFLALKREAQLSRYLDDTLPKAQRQQFTQVVFTHFDELPFYIECAWAGDDLARWSQTQAQWQQLDESQALDLFITIARCVASAHAVGMLHRDIKPSNILIESLHTVRLTDFGSAQLLKKEVEHIVLTRRSQLDDGHSSSSGSPIYLAPELFQGRAASVQSDIYALGVLLYQIVVRNLDQAMGSGWEEAVSTPLLRSDIARATHIRPGKRFHSVQELIDSLQNLHQREAEQQKQAQALAEAQRNRLALLKLKARRPWLIGFAGAVFIGISAVTWMYWQADQARQRAENINAFWNDEIVQASNPYEDGIPSVLDLLEQAELNIESRFTGDPLTQATIYEKLGNAYFGYSRREQGITAFEKSAQAYEHALGLKAERALIARFNLAGALAMGSQTQAAQQHMQLALSRAQPLSDRSAKLRFTAAHEKALIASYQDDWDTAVIEYENAYALQLQIEHGPDERFKLMNNLVDVYKHQQNYARCLELLEQMLSPQLSPQAVGLGRFATARLQYGQILLATGELSRAETALSAALDALKKHLGEDAFIVAVAHYNLADLRLRQQAWEPAIEHAKLANQAVSRTLGESHVDTVKSLVRLSIAQLYAGDNQTATQNLTRAQAALNDRDAPTWHGVTYYLVLALTDAGNFRAARTQFDALEINALQSTYPSQDWPAQLAFVDALLKQALLPRPSPGSDALSRTDLNPIFTRLRSRITP